MSRRRTLYEAPRTNHPVRKLAWIVLLLASLTMAGTAWFRYVDDWTVVDALYMTVITLSTVGFREVNPLTTADKVFVVCFLVIGLGVFMYGVVEIGEMVIRAELRQWWRKRNMGNELKSMHNHFIVCGVGRMGRMVCQHLSEHGVPFVAIDRDEDAIEYCQQQNWTLIVGDATEDNVLAEAGIKYAHGIASVLSTDADNLYVVISARLIRENVRIIARANDDKAAEKMQRAGANQVVSLYTSGATKMAQLLTNPNLGDFFEFVGAGGLTFDLAEISVAENLPLVGKRLDQTDLRARGVIIVGIRKADGTVLIPPPSSTEIQTGDNLFAIGNTTAIAEFTQRQPMQEKEPV